MTTWPRHRTVSDVMTVRVHVASPETPFKFLVQLIEDNRISAVPIVDRHGIPVGIVSEADLLLKEQRHGLESQRDLVHPLRLRHRREKAAGNVASELMTSPPITVTTGTSLAEAALLMQERKVRRLVVVDDGGRIEGIVSRSDLLHVFLRSDEELRHEVAGELVPALFMEGIGVEVHMNVVTLTGKVDRKSDVDLLVRLTKQLDGVVDVVDRLEYNWDDRDAEPIPLSSIDPTSRAV